MPYIIDNRAGQTIVIPDNALNQDFSIDLVGRNYENYGAVIAKSFVDLLDNFASGSAPERQTDGQLWFDTNKDLLRVYDATQGLWAPLLPIVTASASPVGENARGTMYFDKQIGKLFVHDGTTYKQSSLAGEINSGFTAEAGLNNPARTGTRLRNVFIEDTTGVPRPCLTLNYVNSSGGSPTFTSEEKIIAVFSGHAEFTAANVPYSTEGGSMDMYDQLNEAGGIGLIIRPGLNLRDDNDTHVQRSNQAYRADAAYTLNTGSYGADSANITASQVFFDSSDSIPTANATYDVGAIAARMDKIYAQDFLVGNALLALGNDATIGTNNDPFNTIFVEDITVKGNIIMPEGGDIGEESNPINNGYFVNLFVTNELQVGTAGNNGYAFPVDDGTAQQQLFTDGSGQLQFADALSNIDNITAGGGLTVGYTSSTDPVTGLTTRDARLDVVAGNGITVLEDEVFVQENEVNHDGLLNFVTNEHIDHSSVDITAGDGLTGGGNITQSRTLTVGEGTGITVNANNVAVDMSAFTTTDLAEGDNLYFTAARARGNISVLDAGGDGELTYDSGTGVITYTGPSASEVRAHISGNDGVNYTQNLGQFTLDVGYARQNVYSAGDGIAISDIGVISNTGVIESVDTSDFVTTTGNQTIGGEKTFTEQTTFTHGAPIVFNAGSGNINSPLETQIQYGSTLFFHGGTGSIAMKGGTFEAEDDIIGFVSSISDARLKENVQPLNNALQSVSQLQGVSYDWKKDGKHAIGFIAQEVEKVLPSAVTERELAFGEEGQLYKTVEYNQVIALLVESIKELKAEIDELKKGK